MKLIPDMNLSPQWVAFLKSSGLQAEHWSQLGSPSATDAQIMAYAAARGFTVLTHDLDFGAILAATHSEKPSVVLLRAQDVLPAAIGPATVAALRQAHAELENGAIVVVEADRRRVRLLPLKG